MIERHACETRDLPAGCVRGHMQYGAEEWEDEEGEYHVDEWEYCECDEWAAGAGIGRAGGGGMSGRCEIDEKLFTWASKEAGEMAIAAVVRDMAAEGWSVVEQQVFCSIRDEQPVQWSGYLRCVREVAMPMTPSELTYWSRVRKGVNDE